MGFFTRVWKFLMGYVSVTVEGFFLEKFTNLCGVHSIPFWSVKRYGNAKMVGRTTIKGFKQMRFCAKKCGCRVSIGRKQGIPFLFFRYKKRKIFVLGFLFFLVGIKISSMFVWSIDISGNVMIDDVSILDTLEELGVKKGIRKADISVRELANLFMIKRDDVSWVGIDIDGIRLKVKIAEKPDVPDKIDESIACDIVASKPALIVNIDTYQGKSMVSVGDIVDRGTMLVKGVVEMTQFPDKTQYVHALASVKGKVWYEKSRGLKKSELRTNEQIEEFAYKLAYKNIIDSMPKENVEILNVSKSTTYTDEKIIVTVTIESLEEIGVEISNIAKNF